MDIDKLNKAAEEARRETAIQARSDWHHSLDGVSLDVSIDELVESAFAGGAEWVLSQPLSQRLTDDEKDKIKGIYSRAIELYNGYNEDVNPTAFVVIEVFKEIFGADLFNPNQPTAI